MYPHMRYPVTYKIKIFAYSIFFLLCVIALRLVYLQINSMEWFAHRSKKNFLQMSKVQSPRGNILDRTGNLLATNRPLTSLHWCGTGKYRLAEDQFETLETIGTIINQTLTHDEELIKKISRAERHRKQILLTTDLSVEQLSQIAEQLPTCPNISISTHFKRYYPYQSFASHLLGYLGAMGLDQYGKMGLEKLFEDTLKGDHGTVVNIIDSLGRNVTQTTLKEAFSGSNVQTTIDLDIQHLCEEVFPSERSGACIVMDPVNGDLLAVLSRPDFDPAIFLQKISSYAWDELQKDQPFLNRAFNAAYPPGSIFKLITISAALEHDMITPETEFDCKGYYLFGKRKYWCNRRYGHGTLNVKQALAQSCNPLLYDIGAHISVNTLAEYAYKFGLGRRTNVMLPEQVGLVPTTQWKLDTKGERWWPGETLSVAIGQSFLLTTPLQIARMISAIYTGYLVSPRILCTEKIAHEQLAIKEETRKFLKKSMRRVITSGTGKRLHHVKDMKIYAKTSTAQTSAMSKRNLSTEYLEHGWFAGNIVYKDHPPLTMVIVVERAGTAQVATGIAKNFLLKYKKLMDST